jgi:hypothetical protein
MPVCAPPSGACPAAACLPLARPTLAAARSVHNPVYSPNDAQPAWKRQPRAQRPGPPRHRGSRTLPCPPQPPCCLQCFPSNGALKAVTALACTRSLRGRCNRSSRRRRGAAAQVRCCLRKAMRRSNASLTSASGGDAWPIAAGSGRDTASRAGRVRPCKRPNSQAGAAAATASRRRLYATRRARRPPLPMPPHTLDLFAPRLGERIHEGMAAAGVHVQLHGAARRLHGAHHLGDGIRVAEALQRVECAAGRPRRQGHGARSGAMVRAARAAGGHGPGQPITGRRRAPHPKCAWTGTLIDGGCGAGRVGRGGLGQQGAGSRGPWPRSLRARRTWQIAGSATP